MRYLIALMMIVGLSSCLVSKKKFDAQKELAAKLENKLNDCEENLKKANEDLANTKSLLSKSTSDIGDLNNELSTSKKATDKLKKELDLTQGQYDDLRKRMEEMGKSSNSEREKLRIALNEKEKALEEKEKALEEKEKRIKDLEDLIRKKEEAVSALRKRIADALKGFNSSELTVSEKDGKVYVSLSDKLLFKTGSFQVDVKGKSAIVQLSEVLNKQPEIGIVVEGHTDNKAYINPKGDIKNNWDLSVMRATSVTDILINEGKVDPKRITPSGHAEFFPIETNDTPEGRAKNRRIEIVLSPDLKEIFKILEGNN